MISTALSRRPGRSQFQAGFVSVASYCLLRMPARATLSQYCSFHEFIDREQLSTATEVAYVTKVCEEGV